VFVVSEKAIMLAEPKNKKGPSPFNPAMRPIYFFILKPFPSKTPCSSPLLIFFGVDIFYPF